MNGNHVDYGAIGKRIREYRESKGWTQGTLAEGVGVSVSYIGQLERGEKKPSIETIARLCAVMDISADELLFGRRHHCDAEHCELIREISVLIHGDGKRGCSKTH